MFAALELSRKSWLVATSSPGEERISKRAVTAGDGSGLLTLLGKLRETAERRLGRAVRVVVIQEAGLDGFWLHRFLEANGIESHVVDPASIAVDRRKRRRKTDAIDAEGLLRALMAWTRGERRVCSMVRPPSPEDEDRRRLCREREALVTERIRHTNRIKGLLAGQGILDFDPLRPKHRERLEELKTGDGRPLPTRLLAEIRRQLGRLDAVVSPRSKPSAMAWLASARWIGPRRAQRRELNRVQFETRRFQFRSSPSGRPCKVGTTGFKLDAV